MRVDTIFRLTPTPKIKRHVFGHIQRPRFISPNYMARGVHWLVHNWTIENLCQFQDGSVRGKKTSHALQRVKSVLKAARQ